MSSKMVKTIEEGSGVAFGYQTCHSHDLSCRVGSAVQQTIHHNNRLENVREVGTYLKTELKKHPRQ